MAGRTFSVADRLCCIALESISTAGLLCMQYFTEIIYWIMRLLYRSYPDQQSIMPAISLPNAML
ncbi:hypothetical protein BJX76DRAFT_262725 [Aspergillus varians]